MLALRLFAVAALAGGLLAGCADAKTMAVSSKQPMVAAGGDVAVGSFSSVELQGGGHVALRYGAVQRVSLVSGSTEFTRFHIEQGNKLVIDACNDKCPSNYDLSIVIVTPHITGVAISGGGRIESAAGFPAQERLARLMGFSKLKDFEQGRRIEDLRRYLEIVADHSMSRSQGLPERRELAGGNVDHLDGTVLTKKPQHGRRQRTIGHDMLHEDLGGMR